jgi:hypothetical protein
VNCFQGYRLAFLDAGKNAAPLPEFDPEYLNDGVVKPQEKQIKRFI